MFEFQIDFFLVWRNNVGPHRFVTSIVTPTYGLILAFANDTVEHSRPQQK